MSFAYGMVANGDSSSTLALPEFFCNCCPDPQLDLRRLECSNFGGFGNILLRAIGEESAGFSRGSGDIPGEAAVVSLHYGWWDRRRWDGSKTRAQSSRQSERNRRSDCNPLRTWCAFGKSGRQQRKQRSAYEDSEITGWMRLGNLELTPGRKITASRSARPDQARPSGSASRSRCRFSLLRSCGRRPEAGRRRSCRRSGLGWLCGAAFPCTHRR